MQFTTRAAGTTFAEMESQAEAECTRFFGTTPHEWRMDYVMADTFDADGKPTRYVADVQGQTLP